MIPLALMLSLASTDARIVIDCAKTSTYAFAGKEESFCVKGEETAWLDLVVGAQVIAIQLTGKRRVVELGAAPSFGMLVAWRPTWWTATRVLVGGELLVSATVLNASEAFDHVEIWTVGAINLLGYLSLGIGGRYGIATREGVSDFVDLVMTSGLRIPL